MLPTRASSPCLQCHHCQKWLKQGFVPRGLQVARHVSLHSVGMLHRIPFSQAYKLSESNEFGTWKEDFAPNIFDSILISSVIFFLDTKLFQYALSIPPITALKDLWGEVFCITGILCVLIILALWDFFFLKSSKCNLLFQLIHPFQESRS